MIEVKNLVKEFEDKQVLKGISTVFKSATTNLIIGKSGAGKTVLLKSLIGLVTPTSGEILFDGEDLVKAPLERMRELRGRKIGMIFQDPMTSLNPTIKVGKQIMEGILIHKKVTKEEAKQKAVEMLRKVVKDASVGDNVGILLSEIKKEDNVKYIALKSIE